MSTLIRMASSVETQFVSMKNMRLCLYMHEFYPVETTNKHMWSKITIAVNMMRSRVGQNLDQTSLVTDTLALPQRGL